MAVRLREADSIAAVAELRQQIAELEIQVRRDRPLPTPEPPCVYICLPVTASISEDFWGEFIWRSEVEVECFPPSLSTLLT